MCVLPFCFEPCPKRGHQLQEKDTAIFVIHWQAAYVTALPVDCLRESITGHTVDGRNPAPPKRPRNDDYPPNTNKQWFPIVSKWCRISSIHSIVPFFLGLKQLDVPDAANRVEAAYSQCFGLAGFALPSLSHRRQESSLARRKLSQPQRWRSHRTVANPVKCQVAPFVPFGCLTQNGLPQQGCS